MGQEGGLQAVQGVIQGGQVVAGQQGAGLVQVGLLDQWGFRLLYQ